ncbi:aspartate racemase [Duganella sacchari]|uniref:Aspartate racemase n=1 Tax=Duganella sacchari TaxID=551987 RepID=A0A1M7IVI0_9BURK|nr:aspartate racemase [Duganella sacchari]
MGLTAASEGADVKTIGLIGGMSWESTVPYYREVNQTIKRELGGLHSAKVVLYSVDFHEVERLQHAGDWDAAGAMMADAARALQAAGADFIVLCTNTMHKVAPAIEAAVQIPLFHIADPTAQAIQRAGLNRVGLLGTRFTMEQAFYKERLREQHGLEVVVPEQADRDIVHRIIYDELCLGRIVDASRDEYRRIIASLVAQGAQAIILGCTEISLLVAQQDAAVPLFDTTSIHARSAALQALL